MSPHANAVAARNFKRFFFDKSQKHQSFKCTLFYLNIFGLSTIDENISPNAKLHFMLQEVQIPLHVILDVRFSPKHDSATLYFTNSFQRNKVKSALRKLTRSWPNALYIM